MRPFAACLFATILIFATSCTRPAHAAADALPQPATDLPAPAKEGETRTAVFAGGCFWCVEAVFEPLIGVADVVSGYAGGTADTADYKKVSAGQTDHAEVVQVTYDPSKISYGTLLRVFMTMHNPTQPDGQHPDYGRQYRSAIFYASDDEKRVAEAYMKQLTDGKSFDKPIATSLEKLDKFYPAEKYHQDYVKLNPDDPYVVRWALPKIEKLKKAFPELLQSSSAGAPLESTK
jgi:peptide-methionine (S)-S-oxide reductase